MNVNKHSVVSWFIEPHVAHIPLLARATTFALSMLLRSFYSTR